MSPLDRAIAKLGEAMQTESRRYGPLLHRAACGRRREFLSISDKSQYEVGYWSHRDGNPPPKIGPALDGWRDRQEEQSEAARSVCYRVRNLDTDQVEVRFD